MRGVVDKTVSKILADNEQRERLLKQLLGLVPHEQKYKVDGKSVSFDVVKIGTEYKSEAR